MKKKMERKVLTRDAILTAQDIKNEWVDVPEWGGGLFVFGMTAQERDEVEASMMVGKGEDRTLNMKDLRARMVMLCAKDEEGTRIFTDEKDVDLISKKAASAVDRVFTVAQRLSGMTKTDVEELTKNCKATQGEDSSIV